jgi:hypothetical protein
MLALVAFAMALLVTGVERIGPWVRSLIDRFPGGN